MELFCILLHCDFYKQEWSVAPSIFNIKARGLAHCLYWVKLSLDEVYEVVFHAVRTSNNDRHTKRFRNCKKLECYYEEIIRK